MIEIFIGVVMVWGCLGFRAKVCLLVKLRR